MDISSPIISMNGRTKSTQFNQGLNMSGQIKKMNLPKAL